MAANLGDTVRWHRRKAGLSRQQLALLAGVGKTAIFDLEHGKTSLRLDTLLPILKALSLTLQVTGPLLDEALPL